MATVPEVLVLSRKPLRERPLWEWIDGTADRVVLVTTRSALAGVADAAERFVDCVVVDGYQSWWTERAAETAARRYGVSRIASSSEDDVLRAARLRARLGLRGQTVAGALALRDKYVMKSRAAAHGVAVPAFAAVDRPGDLLDFVAAHGYPVVVKPRREAASIGVQRLRDHGELSAWLATGALPATPARIGYWMVEEWVDADLYHVDGVTAGGRIVHAWPSRYSAGNAETVWSQSTLTSELLPPGAKTTAALQEFSAEVLAALPAGPDPVSFHLEAWGGSDGGPRLCEIACRTGGGPIADTYKAAFGVHLSRESLRGQAGDPLTLTEQPQKPDRMRGWAILPPGTGRFRPPRLACPVPDTEVRVKLESDAVSSGATYAGEAAAVAMYAADDAATLAARRDAVLDWWRKEAAWV